MYIDKEGLYEAIETNKYIFFISKNPDDKKYYIIGYFYISNKGEGVASDCKKWLPKDHWNYYFEGDRLKSKMVIDYSNPKKNILFNREFIKNNTELDLAWDSKKMENMSDDGKIGPLFKNNDKTISDNNARKILELIHGNIDYIHPTKDLIKKALYELGKTEASIKNELIPKLKEIVGREGKTLVYDEIATKEIISLNEE